MNSVGQPFAERRATRIVILGGGPAGLYCGLLLKKANPGLQVDIFERNAANVTYGWGVVFSDRTLASFQRADYKTYTQITEQFVIWDSIDVRYRGETIRCGGHVIAAIERRRLLNILQERCAELGVGLHFGVDVSSLADLPMSDLVIAADGVNSFVRREHEELFKPQIEPGKAKYIWLGADKVLDAFNFIFHDTKHGLFQVHAYPFSGTSSTFIVECEEETWQRAGLDSAGEAASLAFCAGLLKDDLNGATLLSNNSRWINFPTLKTRRWHGEIDGHRVALMGDAAHTAHFSIGAGTKLAMEDAIALATALEQYGDIEHALDEYELERKPVVDTFQRAAQESRTYFETLKRYLVLPPMQFAFQLLTRSGRITYDDLHFRDVRFGDRVDSWFALSSRVSADGVRSSEGDLAAPQYAPPPMFAPLQLRGVTLHNRVVFPVMPGALDSGDSDSFLQQQINVIAQGGYGLALTPICAVSPEGRITTDDTGLYDRERRAMWAVFVRDVHGKSAAKVCVQLGHAGRRGATEPRSQGLDRLLREGGWELLSASAFPYTRKSRVPKEISRREMDALRDYFVQSAVAAHEAGFDMLQLNFAQGYLLASFLSPLTNCRRDEYGGSLEARARFPLEVFDAVRAVWPASKPLSVALSATDYVEGGSTVEDAVVVAGWLKERGCDLINVLAGQTTPAGEAPFGRGFLTPLSDRVRNEAGIKTMVGGYLTNSNDMNTILAAGRGDLCVVSPR
ncbi:MAG: FAD-dependent monooxygenase [Chloroflexota bacterium]